MWPYWLFFSLFFINAVIHIRPSLLTINGRYLIRPSLLTIKGRYWSIEWVSIFILLLLIVGLRYQVGADWYVYFSNLENYRLEGEAGTTSSRDIGYHFLNWLSVKFDQEVVLVNFISAIFFSYGLLIFCRNQALPSLSMLVAFPYIVTVVGMGYTRQSIALGFFMLGLVALEKDNYWRYIGLIILGALFHVSAIVLLPLVLIVVERYLFIKMVLLALFIATIYYLILDQLPYVMDTYFSNTRSSPGTTIRYVMVIIPALLLLLNIKRLNINKLYIKRISTSIYAIRLWKVIALSSFFMIIPIIYLPSSTVVDRILLYWLPLQLFVFGNIPVTYLSNKYIYIIIYFMIILYSFAVFAVWFSFGNNSYTWVPYSNYLWL